MSAAPHPDTIDLAKRSIDELQTQQLSSAPVSRLPRVPVFGEDDGNRKLSAIEMEKGGSSEGDESDQGSGEDMYSSQGESESESGETSASNYETSSSFEARKQEQKAKSRMASIRNEKRKPIASPEMSSGSPSDSPDSAPPVPSKGKGKAKAKAPPKKKTSLPRQRKQASKDTPEAPDWNENASKRTKKGKGVKLPVRLVDDEYNGSQEGGIPIVDSRPGKK